MAKYIVIRDFKSPVVYSGGSHPKLQAQVKYMSFKKGSVLDGVLKTDKNGDPSYIIYKGSVVVPISAVRELTTKPVEVNRSAEGSTESAKKPTVITESKNKLKYIDSAIFGALIGLAAVVIGQKKGWIPEESPENKVPHQNKMTSRRAT